jgi:hypothetical protein
MMKPAVFFIPIVLKRTTRNNACVLRQQLHLPELECELLLPQCASSLRAIAASRCFYDLPNTIVATVNRSMIEQSKVIISA